MKKILIINTLYAPNIGGGAELRIQERAEGLKKLGYDVIVLTTTDQSDLSIDYVNDIKVYRAEIKNRYWPFKRDSHNALSRLLWHYKDRYNVKMQQYVEQVIKIEKPHIVICHNLPGWSISVWDVIKRHNLPLIQFLHDYYLLCPSSTMFNEDNPSKERTLISRLLRLGFAKRSNKVDIVIGVSQFIVNKLTQNGYFNNSKKLTSYNQRNIKPRSEVQDWDGSKPLHIGFIGTLCEAKGIRVLIQAFMRTDINAKLFIAGSGNQEYLMELQALAKDDERIIFLGHTKPDEFYQQIDLLVIPSLWHDTLPGVAIESCAYSVPVISSNMGGLPEVIKDQINGRLIAPSIDNLYEMIQYYYNNPTILNTHKKNCRDSVEKIFLDPNKMLLDYSYLIRSLIEDKL